MLAVLAVGLAALCSNNRAQGSNDWGAGAGTPVPGARTCPGTCQDMLAMRRAPEIALRRSRLLALVVHLSLQVAVFRPDALRSYSRVEHSLMREATREQQNRTENKAAATTCETCVERWACGAHGTDKGTARRDECAPVISTSSAANR